MDGVDRTGRVALGSAVTPDLPCLVDPVAGLETSARGCRTSVRVRSPDSPPSRRWPPRAISTLDLSPSAHWAERLTSARFRSPTTDRFASTSNTGSTPRTRMASRGRGAGSRADPPPGQGGGQATSRDPRWGSAATPRASSLRSWIEHLRQHEARHGRRPRSARAYSTVSRMAATAPIVTR